jgi:hypothetical protein
MLGLVALAACQTESTTEPTTVPTPSTGTGGRGLTVAQYMAVALDSIQGLSVNPAVATSPAFRQRYVQRAAAATSYRALYPIIDAALDELDPHSSISPPENLPGSTDAPADQPSARVQGRMIGSKVGYVWVPGFTGKSQEGRVDSTHQVLRGLDANNPCGWVVDLRRNSGGFFLALMASVGPLYDIDEGNVGGQRYTGAFYPPNYQVVWAYRRRANGTDAFVVRDTRDSGQFVVQNPFRPKRIGLPVAVLHAAETDASGRFYTITASAGESITLAFRGGPPSRSFGAPTYGVASGRYPFLMPDTARIDVTDSYMFDRRGGTPGNDPIRPDVAIPNPAVPNFAANDAVVDAAVAWLNTQPSCSGTLADRGPSAQRTPTVGATVEPTGTSPGRRLPARETVYRLPNVAFGLSS